MAEGAQAQGSSSQPVGAARAPWGGRGADPVRVSEPSSPPAGSVPLLELLRRGYGRLTRTSKARVDGAVGFDLGKALRPEELEELFRREPLYVYVLSVELEESDYRAEDIREQLDAIGRVTCVWVVEIEREAE